MGYELTILFGLVAIFGFCFATWVKVARIEKMVCPKKEDTVVE